MPTGTWTMSFPQGMALHAPGMVSLHGSGGHVLTLLALPHSTRLSALLPGDSLRLQASGPFIPTWLFQDGRGPRTHACTHTRTEGRGFVRTPSHSSHKVSLHGVDKSQSSARSHCSPRCPALQVCVRRRNMRGGASWEGPLS